MPAFRDRRRAAVRDFAGIRAVVFDAVGTLITPAPDVATVYRDIGCAHGSRKSIEAVSRLFGRAFRETSRRRSGASEPHTTNEAAERNFWRAVVSAVLDDLNEPAATACFDALFTYFGRPEAWRVFDDVPETIAALSRRGLTLAVASNFDARLHVVFDGHSILTPVARRFFSSEIGWRKPDTRFFAAVCDGLGLSPAQVLYVGDEPETDVEAAGAAGLRALLLRRGGVGGAGVVTELTQLPGRIDPTSVPDGT